MTPLRIAAAAFTLICIICSAHAGNEKSMRPPLAAAAYLVCEGLNAGDPGAIASAWGEEVNGSCRLVDGRLVAMPEDSPVLLPLKSVHPVSSGQPEGPNH